MELCGKILVKNKESAQAIIDNWEREKISSFLTINDFKKFPCVFSYYIDENNYDITYASEGYYSIVYLDDFDEG